MFAWAIGIRPRLSRSATSLSSAASDQIHPLLQELPNHGECSLNNRQKAKCNIYSAQEGTIARAIQLLYAVLFDTLFTTYVILYIDHVILYVKFAILHAS